MTPSRWAVPLTGLLLAGTGAFAADDPADSDFEPAIELAFADTAGPDPATAEHSRIRTEIARAESQIDIGEFTQAQQTLHASIDAIELTDYPDPALLIDAYTALGEAFFGDGLYASALVALDTAREQSRRSFGLLNEGQIGILYDMSRAALADGDNAMAEELRMDALTIYRRSRAQSIDDIERAFGDDSRAVAEARLQHADWLLSQGLIGDARRAYDQTLDYISDEIGRDPALTARVLLAKAEMSGVDLIVLQRARMYINRVNDPSPALDAEYLRLLGDWRLTEGRVDKAERAYRQAWRLLDEMDGGAALQIEWFDEPQFVVEPQHGLLGQGILSLSPDAPAGHVELVFFVDRRGRALNIRVADADPQWMSPMAVRQVASALFRPRVDNGETVVTEGRFIWNFRYDPLVAASLGLTGAPMSTGAQAAVPPGP